jgi:hypothetical protein
MGRKKSQKRKGTNNIPMENVFKEMYLLEAIYSVGMGSQQS